eukprot:g1574.t1
MIQAIYGPVYVLSTVFYSNVYTKMAAAGLASSSDLLPTVINYLGLLFAGIALADQTQEAKIGKMKKTDNNHHAQEVTKRKKKGQSTSGAFSFLTDFTFHQAWMHVTASCLTSFGILFAGSSLYALLYTSAPVWTTILSMVILKKHVTMGKGLRIAVIVGCLLANVLLSGDTSSTLNDESDSLSSTPMKTFGMVCTVLSAMTYSLVNVLSEYVTTASSTTTEKRSPAEVCYNIGLYGVYISAIVYVVSQSLVLETPDFSIDLLLQPTSIFLYFLFFLANFGINWGYFALQASYGTIYCGVLSALSTPLTVCLSHFLFCDYSTNASQCLTSVKLSTSVVIALCIATFP